MKAHYTVIGGRGFIGSEIVENLLAKGENVEVPPRDDKIWGLSSMLLAMVIVQTRRLKYINLTPSCWQHFWNALNSRN